MRLKDLLDVYDNWDNDIVINDDDLKPILKGRIWGKRFWRIGR